VWHLLEGRNIRLDQDSVSSQRVPRGRFWTVRDKDCLEVMTRSLIHGQMQLSPDGVEYRPERCSLIALHVSLKGPELISRDLVKLDILVHFVEETSRLQHVSRDIDASRDRAIPASRTTARHRFRTNQDDLRESCYTEPRTG